MIPTAINREADLRVQTVTREVTAAEIVRTIASYHEGPITRRILWDFTGAQAGRITTADIKEHAALTNRCADRRPGGKTALVFSSDFAYGADVCATSGGAWPPHPFPLAHS